MIKFYTGTEWQSMDSFPLMWTGNDWRYLTPSDKIFNGTSFVELIREGGYGWTLVRCHLYGNVSAPDGYVTFAFHPDEEGELFYGIQLVEYRGDAVPIEPMTFMSNGNYTPSAGGRPITVKLFGVDQGIANLYLVHKHGRLIDHSESSAGHATFVSSTIITGFTY